MRKNLIKIEIPPAQLMYSRSIEVLGSIKEIQLYWGDLSTVVNSKSSVLISSNIHNENRTFLDNNKEPKPIGMAWESLKNKFKLDDNNFKPVLEATLGSGNRRHSKKL